MMTVKEFDRNEAGLIITAAMEYNMAMICSQLTELPDLRQSAELIAFIFKKEIKSINLLKSDDDYANEACNHMKIFRDILDTMDTARRITISFSKHVHHTNHPSMKYAIHIYNIMMCANMVKNGQMTAGEFESLKNRHYYFVAHKIEIARAFITLKRIIDHMDELINSRASKQTYKHKELCSQN